MSGILSKIVLIQRQGQYREREWKVDKSTRII